MRDARGIEKELVGIEGVRSVSVNFASEQAAVAFGSSKTGARAITQAIEQSGYSVPVEEVRLRILGMTCASCAARVERALRAESGVEAVEVNVATEVAHVGVRAGTRPSALIAAVRRAGYDAKPEETEVERRAAQDHEEQRRANFELASLIVAAGLAFPLVAPWGSSSATPNPSKTP